MRFSGDSAEDEKVGGDHDEKRQDVAEDYWDATVQLFLPYLTVRAVRNALVEVFVKRGLENAEYERLKSTVTSASRY